MVSQASCSIKGNWVESSCRAGPFLILISWSLLGSVIGGSGKSSPSAEYLVAHEDTGEFEVRSL